MTTAILSADALEELPTPRQLRKKVLLDDASADFVQRSRHTIEAILHGYDPRLLLVVGPCSIHDLESAKEYAEKIHQLSQKVGDKFFLVMRTYFEKPRTSLGWKGFLYDPFLDGSHAMHIGVEKSRRFLVELAKMGVPTASEVLELSTAHYYADTITWGCVGARTCTSQPHRQLASSLPFPIGFKNTTDGNLKNPIHAVVSASHPHVFMSMCDDGIVARKSAPGNPKCHVVLRGAICGPNHQRVDECAELCELAGLHPRIMVDCSHDNSRKNHRQQIPVFEQVLKQVKEGSRVILGMMLESHLHEGAQKLCTNPQYGVSVTDPCLDWDSTEKLILDAHRALIQKSL